MYERTTVSQNSLLSIKKTSFTLKADIGCLLTPKRSVFVDCERPGVSSQSRASFHIDMGNQNNKISRKLIFFCIAY